MSHYAVLVLHKLEQNIDELLAPYSEHIKVEPYFEMTYEDALKNIKESFVPYNNFLKEKTDKELIEWYVNQYGAYSLKEENGTYNIYSTYNPKSKWDWYVIGGRFSGELKLTDQGFDNFLQEHEWVQKNIQPEDIDEFHYCESAPIKDIQWITPLSNEEKEKTYQWWMANVEGSNEYKDAKDKYFIWKPEYYKQRYKDFNTYLKTIEYPCYHAVITPDGIWHEPSTMGYFACTDGNPEEELQWDLNFYGTFIKPNIDSDLIATIVDCHI